jgi:signal transduction histidine kinase
LWGAGAYGYTSAHTAELMQTDHGTRQETRGTATGGAAAFARAPRAKPRAAIVGAAALSAATLAVALAVAGPHQRAVAVLVHTAMVAVPAAVAAGVLRRRPEDRFAALLLAAAALFALSVLALSAASLPHSVGRLAVWVAEPFVIYLLLAFPSGRLPGRAERAVFAASAALAAVLYVGSAFFVHHFPAPSPWDTCGADCPANAFMLTRSEPGFVADVVQPVREVLTVAVFLLVVVLLVRRMQATGTLGRRVLAPVVATALVRAVELPVYLYDRRHGTVGIAAETMGWLYALTLPLLAVGFAAGLVSVRLHAATVLERLTRRLRADVTPGQLTAEMAEALEDPDLRIVYRAADGRSEWLDETGRPAAPVRPREGRAVSEVRVSDRVAAIEHDELLLLEPGVVEATATYAITALEHDWLVRELQSSLRELSESRARIVTVGAQARRRIERDLHDGAQQRLVALRAHLGLESERLRPWAPASADALDRLATDIDDTIDDVRSIARGLYPSLLADRGLAEALKAAALAAPIPARVDAHGIGRYEAEIEATVYYACIEALQNAGKHAEGATGVWISLSDTGNLRFEVADDGAGFAPAARSAGAGLTNLRDRLAAVGGVVTIESEVGVGTRVAGLLPGRRIGPEGDDPLAAAEPAVDSTDAA